MNNLLPLALTYLQRGYSVIPVGPEKRPLISWKEFQSRLATTEELVKWWTENPDAQIGIITGKVSNLTVIDVEAEGDFNVVKEQTYTVETGGKGRHYYFKYESEFRNAVRIFPLVDVRSEGGYVVAAGSTTSKGVYEALNTLEVATMAPDTKTRFLSATKRRLEPSTQEVVSYPHTNTSGLDYAGFGAGMRNDEMTRYAGAVHAKIHPSLWPSIGLKMFEEANLKNTPPLPAGELRIIWNSIGQAEQRQNPGGRTFTPSAPKTWGPAEELGNPEAVQEGEADPKDTLHASEVARLQIIDSASTYPVDMKPFDDALLGGFSLGEVIVVAGQSGHGKCLAKGTPVLMWNGEIKKVEDIKSGEKLIGPDSNCRNVQSVSSGVEMLYKIIPTRGIPYVVNESHILSLLKRNVWSHGKKVIKNELVNISVKDFLELSSTAQRNLYGYHVGIHWSNYNNGRKLPVDPYFLGLWLGDGDSLTSSVTTADSEIKDYLREYAHSINHLYSETIQPGNKSVGCNIYRENRQGKRPGGLQSMLRSLGVLGNKHIPNRYKRNSDSVRLKLLAGLIDSDGYLNPPGSIEITIKSYILADDIAFLARSLGFFVNIRETSKGIKSTGFKGSYFKVSISGDLSKVPVLIDRKKPAPRRQIKDVLVSQIKVVPVGVGEYYGFQIDGDGLFLLGDFTVTHNTTLIQDWTTTLATGGKTARDKLPVLWFSYEVLARPLWEKFEKMGATPDTPLYMPRFNETGELTWVVDVVEQAIVKWGIKVVAIDHLGFLRAPRGNYANAADSVTHTVRALKKLAVKRGLIICLPVHIRKTNSDKPDLNDIRDSLGIAQESDTVFFIGRQKDRSGMPTLQARLSLIKNRKSGIAVSSMLDFQFGRYFFDENSNKMKTEGGYETGEIGPDSGQTLKQFDDF
jgi:hypothetical protein